VLEQEDLGILDPTTPSGSLVRGTVKRGGILLGA
jgi:hypothetical protein